jgi:hypothetical protein
VKFLADPDPTDSHPHGVPADEVVTMAAQLDALLSALALLRGDQLVLDGTRDAETLQQLGAVLTPLDRFEREVGGVVRALLRAHLAAGGSHGQRAALLDITRDTAIGRMRGIENSQPDRFEQWATGADRPAVTRQRMTALQLRPGYAVLEGGRVVTVALMEIRYDDQLPSDVVVTTTRGETFAHYASEHVEAVEHDQPHEEITGTITTPDGDARKVTIYRSAP